MHTMNHLDDCFAGTPQDFLICITVHKAANTGVSVGELYVKVSLDKVTKNTKTQTNSANPYFNEYFVFEFHCTLTELLRLTVLFELKKYLLYKKNVIVGELMIDLHSVWNQPTHSYFKRWGRLDFPIGESHPNDSTKETCGYLQIDLAIVSQHTFVNTGLTPEATGPDTKVKWPAHHDFDDIKSNLLEGEDAHTLSNIRYFIAFFRGVFTRKSNYLIQVSFAGFKGKTNVDKNTMTPVWNQEISFAWVYPSVAQRFLILVIMHEHMQWKCVAEYDMSLEDIAFNQKPAFGPTYLHLYDPLSPMTYIGRILMELRSEKLREGQPTHVLISKSITAPPNWREELFSIEFLPILGDHIPTTGHQCRFEVQLAESKSNALEVHLRTPAGNFHSKMHTKFFRQDLPFHSCQLQIHLPDNRNKFEIDFYIIEIINCLRSELATFKVFQLKFPHQQHHQAKCLKYIITSILNKIVQSIAEHQFDYDLGVQSTTWDTNRQQYLLEYFTKLPIDLRVLRHKLRSSCLESMDSTIMDIVNELHRLIAEITSLSNQMRVQDDWPELLLTLSVGTKQIAVCRLNAKHFLSLRKREDHQPSNNCWKIKSFLFKTTTCTHSCANCGCNAGLVLGCLSIMPKDECRDFSFNLAGEWASPNFMGWRPSVVQTLFRCHFYIHQAKVRPSAETRAIGDGHARVLFAGLAAETQITPSNCSPIWDAVITINGLALPGSSSWYLQHPPMIAVELYNSENDAVASGQTVVGVRAADPETESNRGDEGRCWGRVGPVQKMQELKNVSPPPLAWVPVAKNGIVMAELLMSVEFKAMAGNAKVQESDKKAELTIGIPADIRPNMVNYVVEVIFVGLRNHTKMGMSMAGKRRAKVMMGDLVLTSGLSKSRVRNSINFLVPYASGVVSLPDQQEYWPAMIATDVMVLTLCNEGTLGAALIPPSPSYLHMERNIKRVKKCAESSAASSTLIMDLQHEIAVEEEEDDNEESPVQEYSYWKRIKNALGLRTAEYANKQALRSEKIVDLCDLREDRNFTWWTKFYNSCYVDREEKSHLHKHKLIVYTNELEQQPQFSYLQDWAVPVSLVHGVKIRKHEPPKEDVYATLKLQIRLTPCQCDTHNDGGGDGDMIHPLTAALNPRQETIIKTLTDMVKVTVRLYVVQGLQLRPRDWVSDSDTYVRVLLGGNTVSDRAHYVPNQSSPVFGRFFELNTTLPADPILEVSIYDHDKRKDQIIGYTRIDLEDRWHSKHRARVGIPQEYSHSGYNMWRDTVRPSFLLSSICLQRGISPPNFYGNIVEVDGMLFGDETVISKTEDLQERLSVTVLRNLDKLPSFGYKLVPEHVETRSIYRDDNPGILQGKIQMWVELYGQDTDIPPPLDITPVPPIDYEIRVVVKELTGVLLGDKNVFGKLMSDIYVIGWCEDANHYQSTDIHFRSYKGDAAFNWRMIFPMKYSPNEDMMVIRHRGGMLGEEIEIKKPPVIYFQVWDKDVITRDDYLGSIDLNLSNLPMPYPTPGRCHAFPHNRQRLNLFNRKTVTGWFPLPGPTETTIAGKIKLQLDVCTETEASNTPAGLAHSPPMALEPPERPETSFNPLTHPFKSAHLILWPVIRKYVYMGLLFIFAGIGLTLFFFNLPNKLMSIPLQ